jgi:hypothetical protein
MATKNPTTSPATVKDAPAAPVATPPAALAIVNHTAKPPAVSAESFGRVLTLTFADGRVIELDANKTPDAIREAAMMHGFKQKLLDAAAIARNTLTGASASLSDKFDAVQEVFDRLTRAEGATWNKGRAEGGGSVGGILKRALMQLTGKTAAEIETYLADKSKAEQAALRKNPKVAAIILELQTAGADDAIDTDELLGELMGD